MSTDLRALHCVASLRAPQGTCRAFWTAGQLALRLESHGRPRRLLWQHTQPLPRHAGPLRAARLALQDGQLVLRWREPGRWVRLSLPLPPATPAAPGPAVPAMLARDGANPMLAPRATHPWEALAVFNAAAIVLDGRVHLVYRAVGHDGRSVFGHATSSDGRTVDERSDAPVFVDDGASAAGAAPGGAAMAWCSGPSHCGCEDPRLTRIGDTLYMTYTRFDGEHPPGVALTAISVADFVARRWRWRPPVMLSAPHEAHKNWVVFPEPIAGRCALLHGISPGILLATEPTLDFETDHPLPSHYACAGRDEAWDNRVRGAGPPPIRTAAGWLLLYHAMDRRDPGRYKLGAMLLDLHDPTRILGRLPHPLLAPEAPYENEGLKPGVVYACGAAVLDGWLHVYYGGADTVVCVATVALGALLEQLRPGVASAPARGPWRPHVDAQARSRQPAAGAARRHPLGDGRGLQPRRGAAWGHLAPRLPRAVDPA